METPLSRMGIIIVIIVVATAALSPLAPFDPNAINLEDQLAPMSSRHILGTDFHGRDVFSRLVHGARTTLIAATITVVFAAVIGCSIGLTAGYLRGIVDSVIMRTMDIILSFPAIVLAIALTAALGASLQNAMISITVVTLPAFARVARGQTLVLREMDYVQAARATGVGDTSIVLHHILPNCLGPIVVQMTLYVAVSILTTAGLGFLGLGAQPPTPEWGADLAEGMRYMRAAPWVATFPGLAVFIAALGFNLLGDGLADIMNPKLRE